MEKKILIVISNGNIFPGGKASSGFWLASVARFVNVLKNKGLGYIFVSPKGGEVFIDPNSLGWLFAKKIDLKYSEDAEFRESLKNTLSPNQIKPKDFDAIYFSDGYAGLADIPENYLLQAATQIIYENGGVVASLGHGLCGLLNVRLSNGSFLIEKRTVTGVSNLEELLSGNRKYVPYSVEDEAQKKGAKFTKATFPFAFHLVSDNQIVTGQTSCATGSIANEIIRILGNITDSLKEAQKIIETDKSLTLKPSC